jgi:hypothetical protein
MSEKHFTEVQPRKHRFPRSLVISLTAALAFSAGVGGKTLLDRHNAEEARERLNTISVAWHDVEGFKDTQTDVIRFPGDPEQAGKARLDCDRIGIIALTATAVREQITDRDWNVGVARWSTDNPNVAHIASVGSADQLGSQSRPLRPEEIDHPDAEATNDTEIRTIGARVCEGPLAIGLVAIDQDGTPHGVRGTEQFDNVTAREMAADTTRRNFMNVPIV